MKKLKASEFPSEVRLRDTGHYDDLGGSGQRIYTTAGQGYEKQLYIKAEPPKVCRWKPLKIGTGGFFSVPCKKENISGYMREGEIFCCFCGGHIEVEGE